VDGQSSKGSDNRKKILNKRLSASDLILAKDFTSLKQDDSRALVRDNDVLYIYHNKIDETGVLATEEQVFDATEETITEMMSLIKKLTNANVNNILLTADHGFIYQYQALAESDFLSSDPQASTVLYRNRRFLLGKGFQPHPSFKHFHSSQLGLVGDVEVMLPKSINRLRLQGSSSRFVHGAASLQEIVIPLLHINKKRQSDLSQVDIEVLRGSANKITTNHLSVMLYQLQPVTDKCRPRTLRIGLYSEAGALISDSHEVIFDRQADNPREREIALRLMLTSQADNLNGQTVSLMLEEQIEGTSHYKPYTALNYLMQRSFTRDFDF
ncbi:MAG TPA: BREX-1 system phosphatase PglZ type A, partial [Agitococcus sp.]|nr:BREX-1 system phosphatase PglZ type A [Agitococcus sp.]